MDAEVDAPHAAAHANAAAVAAVARSAESREDILDQYVPLPRREATFTRRATAKPSRAAAPVVPQGTYSGPAASGGIESKGSTPATLSSHSVDRRILCKMLRFGVLRTSVSQDRMLGRPAFPTTTRGMPVTGSLS